MALRIEMPGGDPARLRHLVCDRNVTLVLDGIVLEGIAERAAQFAPRLTAYLATAETCRKLAIAMHRLTIACVAFTMAAQALQQGLHQPPEPHPSLESGSPSARLDGNAV